MPTVLDSLVLEFNLDTSQFTREQQRLMDRLRALEEDARTQAINIEAQFKRMSGIFANLQRGAIGIIGGFFGGQALTMIDHFNNLEARVGRVGQVIGMSAERTMAWSNAFKAIGQNAEEGLGALQATTQVIQQAGITGDMSAGLFRVAAILRGPGQAPIDIMHGGAGGGAMTPEQAWLAMSQRMDEMGIQGPRRGALLGMAGAPQFMLMQSTQQIKALVDQMQKLAPLTAEQVKQAQEFQKDVAELDTAFSTLGRYITHELTPTLIEWMAKLKDFIATFNPQDPGGQGEWASWLGAEAVHRWLEEHLTPAGKRLIGFDAGRGGGGGAGSRAPNDAEREKFIRDTAKSLGLDPDMVVDMVWSKEGRFGIGPRRQSTVPGEQSFGDFQLNMKPGALGDLYKRQTGFDPGDPAHFKEEDLWALRQMRFNPRGLAPWSATHGKIDPHAGGAGTGGSQHLSFNIQNMNVNGANAAQVATDIGRQTERMKMAYYGNSAAV